MLLNKLPCLDLGYVAHLSTSCTSEKLNDVAMEFFKQDNSQFLRELSTLTLAVKCPLFIQLMLSTYDFKILSTPVTEIECYIPNVGEINANNLQVGQEILSNIKAASDALHINPKAFQADGCDKYISQVLTPLNTYTTLIVHGSYNEWKRFCNQQKVSAPVKSYIKAVTQIMNMEWRS